MPRAKKCKNTACGEQFDPTRPFQHVCSPRCAIDFNKQQERKKFDKRTRELKKQSRSSDRGYQLKKTQEAFNRYIRVRDESLPCVSCGRHHEGQYHAGHYRTTKAHPELRFEELNCHKQCSACNTHLSGNITEYRISLLHKIGEEALAWLEGTHETKNYTIEDLKEIRKKYTEKAKELESVDPFTRWINPFVQVNLDAVTGSSVDGY